MFFLPTVAEDEPAMGAPTAYGLASPEIDGAYLRSENSTIFTVPSSSATAPQVKTTLCT